MAYVTMTVWLSFVIGVVQQQQAFGCLSFCVDIKFGNLCFRSFAPYEKSAFDTQVTTNGLNDLVL